MARGTGLASLWPAVFLTLFSLSWATLLTVRPRPHQPVAALFPPSAAGDRALAAALAGGATLTARLLPGSEASRFAIAVALMGLVSLLVYDFNDHPWQIDMHMVFFADLAMLTAFCDWKTLLVAAVAVALHHLLLNFLYPAAVFPGGGDFGRVVLHAVIVVVEVAALCWISHRLSQALVQSAQNLDAVNAARAAHDRSSSEHASQTEAERAQRRAQRGDLARRFQAAFGQVIGNLNQQTQSSRQSAADIKQRLDQVDARLTEALHSAGQVEGEVDNVGRSALELLAAVTDVTRSITESSQLAGNAVAEVNRTNKTVETLAEAAHKIGNVVSLIQDIASQTNLLALNATIEAARAGEAGKGFAVVAGEVKHLATQTARATEDIGTQVAEIQSVTGGAVSAIRDIGAIIGRIEQAIVVIAQSAQRQSQTINAITRRAETASSVVATVSTHVHEVSAVTGSLAALSARQTDQVAVIARDVEGLVGQVDAFVVEVNRA